MGMKDIMLKIVGKQIYVGEEEEKIELVTEGKFYKKGESLFLEYDESEFSGLPGCKTHLQLTGDIIRMKRIGDPEDETVIQFETGKRTMGFYETPFGVFEMEVLTNHVENNMGEEGEGSLDIDYHISLRGLSESHNKLKIEVM